MANALTAYQKRSKLGFWDQEVYVALINAARLQLQLGYDADEVLQTFAEASTVCPQRAEAFHDSARLLRSLNRFKEGYALASKAEQSVDTLPTEGLFLENWIYEYGMQDELSVLAYHTERYEESLRLSIDLLSLNDLPADYRKRIASNARFALGKLS
jgi:hypothetical protein